MDARHTLRTGLRAIALAVAVSAVALQGVSSPAVAAIQSFSEDFSTTTYQDSDETTAFWNTTAGELELHPFALSLAGT